MARACIAACYWLAFFTATNLTPAADSPAPLRYQLLEGSTLVDDCPVCDRPTLIHPARGTFDLVLVRATVLSTMYRIENLDLRASSTSNLLYTITGTGSYQVGGEFAVTQDAELQAMINGKPVAFTNANRIPARPWPMLELELAQTNGTLTQQFYLTLVAAPVRELWFTTDQPFSADSTNISPGDILANSGRIVRTDQELLSRLGLMPALERHYPVDALDVWPGGEMVFSLNEDVFSEKLGRLGHGDLLSHQGRVIFRNSQLLSAFGLPKDPPDAGLDAVTLGDSADVWFSIHTRIAESAIGALERGDILSNRGLRVRGFKKLLSHFRPPDADHDYGLDALHVWPSGEIWFSTEEGFVDQGLGPISDSDLLSDRGAIVWRQADLLANFKNTLISTKVGLDGIFLFSDAYATVNAPSFESILSVPSQPGIEIRWQGPGKVFQLEKAMAVTGPYQLFGLPTADNRAEDREAGTNAPPAFYRLRQW